MTVTAAQFRSILDETEVLHHLDDQDFEFIFTQTEPFQADFKFIFTVNEEKNQIQAHGMLCDIDLAEEDMEKAYIFCNQWNKNAIMPKVYVYEEGKMLLCEWTWDTECDLTDDFVKGLILGKFVHATEFFVKESVEAGIYRIPGYITENQIIGFEDKES